MLAVGGSTLEQKRVVSFVNLADSSLRSSLCIVSTGLLLQCLWLQCPSLLDEWTCRVLPNCYEVLMSPLQMSPSHCVSLQCFKQTQSLFLISVHILSPQSKKSKKEHSNSVTDNCFTYKTGRDKEFL